MPFFADAASKYSESHDQPAWDIQPSGVAPELDDLDKMVEVVEGAVTVQVRVICRVSVRLTIKVFSTTLKMK
jgi:hypothetical protein